MEVLKTNKQTDRPYGQKQPTWLWKQVSSESTTLRSSVTGAAVVDNVLLTSGVVLAGSGLTETVREHNDLTWASTIQWSYL